MIFNQVHAKQPLTTTTTGRPQSERVNLHVQELSYSASNRTAGNQMIREGPDTSKRAEELWWCWWDDDDWWLTNVFLYMTVTGVQSCPWVGSTRGLGWVGSLSWRVGFGRVGSLKMDPHWRLWSGRLLLMTVTHVITTLTVTLTSDDGDRVTLMLIEQCRWSWRKIIISWLLPSWKAVNSTQWSKRALSLWCAVNTGSRWDCIAQSRLVVQLFVLCARRQRGMTDTQPSNSQTRYSLHFTTLHFISSWSYTSGNVVVWLALKFLSRQINSAAAASAYWRANWYSRSVCLSGRMSRSGILWKRLNLLS